MNNILIPATALLISVSGAVFAEGDAAKGEKDFKKCKTCHKIASADEVIFKGGKAGPNLYGVVGRRAASVEGFKYGASLLAAGEAELVWTEELLIKYIADPKAFLKEMTADPKAKSKMTFKMKNAGDVAAYLASVSPAIDVEATENDGS